MDIRKEIKKILLDKGMSQKKLAESKGMSEQALSNKLSLGRFKVNELDEWLNELGYRLTITKKSDKDD